MGLWAQRVGGGEVGEVKRAGEGRVRRLFRIHELAHWNLCVCV